MNFYQPPPARRTLSATSVAAAILFLLLAAAIAFLRGPRVAAGLLGAAIVVLAVRLLLTAQRRGPSRGRPAMLLIAGVLVLAGSLSWPQLSGLVAREARSPRAAAATTPIATLPPVQSTTPTVSTAAPPPTGRPAMLRPDRVLASATADPGVDGANKPVSYDAANLVDGDATSAWRVDGDGIGTTVQASWNEPVTLSSIGLVPGYAKIDARDHTDRFHQERRVVSVRCSFDHDPAVTVNFSDLAELQSFAVDVTTSTVTIEILQTTPAPERDFTAISELAFQGRPA